MNKHSSDEIIDEFIRDHAGQGAWRTAKVLLRMAFMVGRLDVVEFAKDAGVSEDAVRRYFGDDDTDEPEGDDESDTVDEHVSQLEKDADNILDNSADIHYNEAIGFTSMSDRGLLDQLNAINHQLNILIHIIATGVKG